MSAFGAESPVAPVLRCRNATQTSVVLEWDPISLATASLRSLSLYRNGNKAGAIPRPLEITSTKISGLAVDTEYTFYLVLKTSAGTYGSEKLTIKTHKMTDLSGITVTPGFMPRESREELEATIERMGAKLIEQVRIDTTHFVCAEGRGTAWEKAMDMNIPVVQPEWLKGCEKEGRLVGVRGYYLNAERPRQESQGQALHRQPSNQNVPQQQRPIPDRQRSHGGTARSQTLPTTQVTPPTPEVPTVRNMGSEAKSNGKDIPTPTPTPSTRSEGKSEDPPLPEAPSTPNLEPLEKEMRDIEGVKDAQPASTGGIPAEDSEFEGAETKPEPTPQHESDDAETERDAEEESPEGQETFDEIKL